MSARSKVVWSQGLFVKPQHFQQQARHIEHTLTRMVSGSEPHFYGFTSLTLNEDLLWLGKVDLRQAAGVMPDGTVFDFPADDLTPAVLDVSADFTANELVYLCLPLSGEGNIEVDIASGSSSRASARYEISEYLARDNSVQAGEVATLKIARVRPILALGSSDLSAYARIAVARIIEKAEDGKLLLDPDFLPTALSISAAPSMRRTLSNLADGVDQRARSIAARVGKPDQSGVTAVSDFLLLQVLNRIGPMLRHYTRQSVMHPRTVFELLIQMAGELSTFMTEERFCPELPAYNHDRPDLSWRPVVDILRRLIARSLDSSAEWIPLESKSRGYVLAPISDRDLIRDAEFVLAIKASVPQDRLQHEFTAQAKVASMANIRDLVSKQLPGIPLRLMAVAPRQLPYHAGYSYFALDRSTPAWRQMAGSEGFAFHVAGDFPGLEMQFWAIKG
ncbi:MAG: type VI secretion system baseplate subunit TssK [Rhizobiaceae bacterium]|nr:type VI secretion system baseplate subunit TssK [Rhizobiaceae bacterium]